MKKIFIKKNHILKKIFIKLCRKLGFEIVDQNSLILPTSNKSINENLNLLNKKSITLPLGEVKITRKINSFLIILRTFTNENKLLQQNKKRLFEKEKKEYTLRSLVSICKNIKNVETEFEGLKVFLKIIDDNSKPEIISQIQKICANNKINYELSNLDLSRYENKMNFRENKRMLAHNSHIYDSKNFALKSNFDIIYFVEDDYLHEHDAFIEMIYTYQKISSQINEEIVLCPSDYPYLYINTEHTKNFIGFKKHWREVQQSLCTYLISKKTLEKYWKYYEDMFLNNYDPYEKPLHELYKKINCLSPMPSLSLHLTNINSIYGLSPVKNWKELWEKNSY
ncbi:rhamnosyl transferase [Candidatus Pelagibacter sp.]|nr:rhamnosyl transferase [Candidatus Pelagibacter sp.]